ncbi:hypothetical protein XANCAGTX0491_005063 [Xanthoria calcicola]
MSGRPRGGHSAMVGRGGFQGPRRQDPVSVYVAPTGVPCPKQEVTKAEDAQLKQLQSARQADSAKFPARPGHGTRGEGVTLWANFFEMVAPNNLVLHRYAVTVVEPRNVNGHREEKKVVGKKLEQVFRLILECQELRDYRNDIVTDFKAQLLSRIALGAEALEAFRPLRLPYRAELEDDARVDAPLLEVSIAPVGPLAVSELIEYLTSTNVAGTFDKQPILQALNIFLGHYTKQCPGQVTVGHRSFPLAPQPNEVGQLHAGLIAVRGFFSSIRVATSRILVNVNVTHAAFYNPTALAQSMNAFGKDDKGRLQSFLKRVRVRATHLKPKNKAGQIIPVVKTIFGLANTADGQSKEKDNLHPPPQVAWFGAGPRDVKFWKEDTSDGKSKGASSMKTQKSSGSSSRGSYISVAAYFQVTYGMQTHPDFPVVNVGTSANPSYLPAEVCTIVPGQISHAKLSPAQTDGMIRFAVRRPTVNAQSIDQDGPTAVGLSPHIVGGVSRFGVNVGNNMITVPGRILNSPEVQYSTPKGMQRADVGSGSWNMVTRNKVPLRFNVAPPLKKWHAIVLHFGNMKEPIPASERASLTAAFDQALRNVGINATRPAPWEPVRMANRDDRALANAMEKLPPQHSIVMIILPTSEKWLYDRIKSYGDKGIGLHTVCVLGEKLRKSDPQTMANVAHKFNLKHHGVNQKLGDAKLGFISKGTTMIVGIDVTHPSPGSVATAPSVAGMVASVDAQLGQWPADLRIQSEARQESVSTLDVMLKTRLDLWFNRNKQLPQNILVYRDGVADTQYDMVLQEELPLLRKACSGLYGKNEGPPNFTIVVVGKRHHARFFPTKLDAKVTDPKNGNPRNGTVVDRHVTEARNWDFFLQSHAAIQGTARPAHYYVVLDEIFPKLFPKQQLPHGFSSHADLLEELTHNLCYVFGRATKAVSLCTPVYYAHLVCERARCYLSQYYTMPQPGQTEPQAPTDAAVRVHDRIKDDMFYI